MNGLQNDRFRDEKFLYLQTKSRKKIFDELMILIESKEKCILSLTGLQGSGKSHFLADFVLRNRLEFKSSKMRILYVNNCAQYVESPFEYIFYELLYLVFRLGHN